MKTQRAFRPDALNSRLETREVLSVSGVAVHMQTLAAQRAAALANQVMHLNMPFAIGNGNGVLNRTIANPVQFLSVSRTFTPSSNAVNSLLGFTRVGFSNALANANAINRSLLASNITSGSTNASALGLGAQTGLTFNNGLGVAGNLLGTNFGSNFGTTGLNFNNGLGTAGNLLGTNFGSNFGTTGLNFNNGLGLTGLNNSVNSVIAGLTSNNGLGTTGVNTINGVTSGLRFNSGVGTGFTGLNGVPGLTFNNGTMTIG